MFGKTLISLSIPFDDLFLPLFGAYKDAFLLILILKMSVDNKEILPVSYVLTSYRIEVAFAVCQMVNGIENRGFTHTIVTHKAVDLMVQLELAAFKNFCN